MFRGHAERYLYGDQAYSHLYGIMGPFPNQRYCRGSPEYEMNKRLSSMRIAVENCFGLMQNLWTANAWNLRLKIGAQPVGAYYLTAVLLTNCWTCIKGNQVGGRFGISPPTLQEYLQPGERNLEQ